MGAFPREGFLYIARRLRMGWLLAVRLRVRRALAEAEAELGWLGWEQVDFFDSQINEEVKKVQEFENTQASLLNTSAELSGQKAVINEDLSSEKTGHDEAQFAFAAERESIAAGIEEAETRRCQKLEAVERFDSALAEIARLERELAEQSLAFMDIEQPSILIRARARQVSDELARLSREGEMVLADQAAATREAAHLAAEIARFRAELHRIDAASGADRDHFAFASRLLTGEMRKLEREREKSDVHMSRLDREKRKPYRLIGACLADHGIAPLNQPEVFEKVIVLRERDASLTQALSALQAACAAVGAGVLIVFYILLAAMIFALAVGGWHFL